MAELVDARDLKSLVPYGTCRFDSGPPHQQASGEFALAPAYESGSLHAWNWLLRDLVHVVDGWSPSAFARTVADEAR